MLYHGSENIIEIPEFGKGKENNDYGRGFYCTENCDMAMEWAVDKDRDGYANCYDFAEGGLDILNLNGSEYNVLNWIAILLDNREFLIDSPIAKEAKRFLLENCLPKYEHRDVIRGFRADDSYFSFARDFINNTISVEQLSKAMRLGNLGEQIVIKSREAFSRIHFIEAINSDNSVWYPRKEQRDRKARSQYNKMNVTEFRKGETYILKLLEGEVELSELCIR